MSAMPSPLFRFTAGRARGIAAIVVLLALGGTPAVVPAQQTTPHGDLSGSLDVSATGTTIEQIGTREPGSAARIDQQTLPSTLAAEPTPEEPGGDATPPGTVSQLAAPDAARDGVRQVTDAERSATVSPQLSPGGRSVTAATPLSSPSQGRPEGVVHLKGKDRCDPHSAQADNPACAHPIETRAAEFTRPAPTELTPEQRLLIRQNALANDSTMQSTLRRIGRNDIDPDDPDAQGVASIVLDSAPPPSPAPDPITDASPDIPSDIVVQTIVRALQQ